MACAVHTRLLPPSRHMVGATFICSKCDKVVNPKKERWTIADYVLRTKFSHLNNIKKARTT